MGSQRLAATPAASTASEAPGLPLQRPPGQGASARPTGRQTATMARHLPRQNLLVAVAGLVAGLLLAPSGAVVVQQFGMCQCPMTSTWFSTFYDACLKDKPHMLGAVNFTQFYVGGKKGGPVTEQTWNSSFHGYEEVVGDIYQLCARQLDETAHKTKWLEFEACANGGLDGILGIEEIPKNSARCAKAAGLDFAALHACAAGGAGLAMFKASVFYTSDRHIKYDTLIPGSGKLENIPVVHIDGRPFTGFDAYANLTSRLCKDDPSAMCGCDEGAIARGRARAEAELEELRRAADSERGPPACYKAGYDNCSQALFEDMCLAYDQPTCCIWCPAPAAAGAGGGVCIQNITQPKARCPK
eukprot:SAG22_NODE_231_length_14551_cov_22.298090_18_plen_357_part_00